MKEIIRSKYAPYFLVGLLLTLLSAWFSTGFYHADEHIQVLEFASWRMGITSGWNMPWEFHQQVRASLLPSVVWLISKILQVIGLYNPFTVTFLLRLFTGFATWFISCLLCLRLSKNMKTEKGERLFILMVLFLWFIPFLSIRFTAENISGVLFLYGFYILFQTFEKGNNSIRADIAAGFLFGLSFYIRAPLIIAILAYVLWLIKIKKIETKYLFVLFGGALIAIALNALLDCWFYREPVFTLLNFIKLYVQHSTTGVPGIEANPWYFYVEQFAGRIIPPFSLFLLVVFYIGVYKNRKDPLVWVIIPFVVIHSIIRHKELRFLFPMIFIFIYVTALGLDYLFTKKSYLKWHKYIYAVFLVVTIPLLLIRTFTPANLSISYCRYMYNHVEGKNIPFFVVQENTDNPWNPLSPSLFVMQNNGDFSFLMTHASFYNNPDVRPVILKNNNQLNNSLDSLRPDIAYYLDKSEGEFNAPKGYKSVEVYSVVPSWLASFTALYCDDKAAFWKIYRLSKT